MLEYHVKGLVILLFMTYGIKCESCVTYDFEAEFSNNFSNDNLLCNGLPRWNIGNYSSLDIQSPSSNSEVFIKPNEILSCVSSFSFEMEATGVIEAYVYVDSVSQRDQLVVLAHQASEDGNDAAVGTAIISPMMNNFENGWHILRISLVSEGTFNGYVSFLGSAAEGSTIIVDSFRYVPPSQGGESCEVYEDLVISPPSTQVGECASFSFEKEFDVTFNSDRGFCSGLSPWSLKNYTSVTIGSPSSDSEQFITPSSVVSCVSSYPFAVEAGGTIEVNIYMEAMSEYDQIGVIANQIISDGNHAVTGSAVLTPLRDDYTDGWHILTVTLSGDGSYVGYVSFFGVASEESTVLIDSFRYIPPAFTQQDCRIYEIEDFEIRPEEIGNYCVTYNFESDFDTAFDTSNQICNGHSTWNLGTYYSLAVDSISPQSSTFVSPNETASCMTSFTFPMKPGGLIEVNVYMESVSSLDYMIVLAKKVVPNGVDTVAGFELYYTSNDNFVQGWNVLKVTVMDFTSFEGYITLIGSTAEDSVGLVDSFRYIPPDSDLKCDIY